MLIDSHIHVFPDALAPKVIPKLAAISGYDNQTDGTLSSTLEKMREWGVDKGVFLSIATKPSQQKSINDFCASIASDTVIPFGSVHPDAPDWESEMERIVALGLKGIKLHPDYQDFDMDEPRVLPIFQKARDLGLCVVVHAGFCPLSPKHIPLPPPGLPTGFRCVPGDQADPCPHGRHAPVGRCGEMAGGCTRLAGHRLLRRGNRPHPAGADDQIPRRGENLFASDCPWSDPRPEKVMIEALDLRQREKMLFSLKISSAF